MIFPHIKVFVDDVISRLVEKIMFIYVHLALTYYISSTYTLWMSKGVHDVFAVVVNFLSNKWEAKHFIIRLFKMFDTNGVTMARSL
jgi:hypothetical protein